MLNDLPRHVQYYPEPKITYHTESVSLDLDAKEQEVHLNIPLDVSATEWSQKKTKEVKNSPSFWNAWCVFGCSTHLEEHGCDGSGHFQASVVLHASFNLASGSLYWQQANVPARKWGECLDDLPRIKSYHVWEVVDNLQKRIQKRRVGPENRQRIKLASGARLFLEFQTPRIVEADGTKSISGSVFGCVQDSSKQLYPISPSQRSLQRHCRNQLLFTKHESHTNQPIRLGRLDSLDSLHLVFRWHGNPKVAINLGNAFEQVTAKIAEKDSGYSAISLTSTQLHSSSAKSDPPWLSWLPPLQRRIREFREFWQGKSDTTRPFPGRSQNQDFWLSITETHGQQQVSIGKGSAQGHQALAQKNISARGPLDLSLSSFDSSATWQVSFGQTEPVCDHGMPTTLSQGHGVVRLSTQLRGAVLGVQAQHFKHYVSKSITPLRDAKIHHSLEVGDIQLKVMTPEAVKNLSFVSLSIENLNTAAQCDGRVQPLLNASLDRFQGPVSLIGRKDGDGKLILSMALLGSDASSYSLQGPHLWNPSVPVAQAAVQANKINVMKRLLPDLSHKLNALDLVLPHWLAQFIPCEVQSAQAGGRCLNMGLPHGSSGQGFVEFSAGFSADDQVPDMFLAANPASCDLVKGWLKKAYAFMQSRPKLTSLFVAFLCLAWIGLAWCRSPKYAVSAFVLSILLYSWYSHSPFAGFTPTALSESGAQITSIESVVADMQNMTQIAMVCTLLELLIVPCWVDLFNFFWQRFIKAELACSEKEDIAYWCFSALVLRSQVWLLVDMPLVYFLGTTLGTEIEADSAKLFPSSPLHVVEVAFDLKASQIHHMAGTMISCSFTSMFVSFIGMYLIYFLLALPVGMFLGAVAFVVIDGPDHWSPRVANTTALCLSGLHQQSFYQLPLSSGLSSHTRSWVEPSGG